MLTASLIIFLMIGLNLIKNDKHLDKFFSTTLSSKVGGVIWYEKHPKYLELICFLDFLSILKYLFSSETLTMQK